MPEKKTICVISASDFICTAVKRNILALLGQHVEVDTWCIGSRVNTEEVKSADVYLCSSLPVYDRIKMRVGALSKLIIAKRTLEIDSLEEALSLPPGTEALVVSPYEEIANEKIELLNSFGLNRLKLYPYWHGKEEYPKHVRVALVTGAHRVPPEITKVVNVGVRSLDLSTYMELILALGLPSGILNDISTHYINAIVGLARRLVKSLEQSENLKRRLEVILDSVDQAIIAIDEDRRIEVFNPAAEKLLHINSEHVLGCRVQEIIPEINYEKVFSHGEQVVDSIRVIRNNSYVINVNPITDHDKKVIGIVTTLKPTREVKELDSKVRRELKVKGNVVKYSFHDIIGESENIKNIINMAKKFAVTDLPVLIEGESGTGKELFAQSIHSYSLRKELPFVAANFAALPETLVESELFGYEEGAFTGAKKGGKTGLFEEAHTGTIFLDEIGDISIDVQKKLLRVPEEKEVRRVGSRIVTPIDVRIIAATNRNLREMVAEGKFREDLYYRLCAIQLLIPSLRVRKADIKILMQFFAQKLYNRELKIDGKVASYLNEYDWPGNIRELQNTVKFMCGMVAPHETATLQHLPNYLTISHPVASAVVAEPELTAEGMDLIIHEFDRQGYVDQLRLMLQEVRYATKSGRGLGRKALQEILAHKSYYCTEHQIRLWLRLLEQGGFIAVGSTKQGCKLTSLGENLIQQLDYDSAKKTV